MNRQSVRDPKTGRFVKSPFAPVLFEDAHEAPSRAGWYLLAAAVVVGIVAAQVLS